MQASTVQNPANIPSSPMPGAKPQGASDVPFNQMLSQQMSERSNAQEAKPAEKNTVNKTNKSEKTEKEPASRQAAKETDATDTKTAAKDAAQDGVETAPVDSTAPVSASAELMALVATQMSQSGKSDSTAEGAGDKRIAKPDVRGLTETKTDLSKQIDVEIEADADVPTGKDASFKSAASFAATMSAVEQSANAKQSVQLAAAKAQDALPGVTTTAATQLQHSALNATQAVTSHAENKLAPQVGSPGWDQALGQKVVWMVAGSQQSASLTLNPPDLGPLQVVLKVTNGHADASFTANLPEVRQALEAALPKLREMMNDAGIQLDQATVSAGMPNQQNQSDEQTGQRSRGANQTDDATDAATRISSTAKAIGGQGLVDTFA